MPNPVLQIPFPSQPEQQADSLLANPISREIEQNAVQLTRAGTVPARLVEKVPQNPPVSHARMLMQRLPGRAPVESRSARV
jgi:hypothetical protein